MQNMNEIKVIADGIMTVFYMGRLIALVNAEGKIIYRDEQFPLFLVEYIIECPDPSPEQVRLN